MITSPVRDDVSRLADRIRLRAVRMVAPHGFGYLGQALSSAEIIAALFSGPYRAERDTLVCSPGHYIIGFFAAAGELGMIDDHALATYGQDGSKLEAIGTERSPVVDLVCGSLGQGLSGGVAFAMSDQMRGDAGARVFVLVSDGELEEGQTLGGGDVRRAPQPREPRRPGRRQQLAGGWPRVLDHHA